MRELNGRHYAVKGTPTAYVIMGVRFLMKNHPPDLIMSGINQGQNLADDVSYSGTVAGAIEGALLGVPSIAMSLVIGSTEIDQGGKPKWETPMQHGAPLVRKLLQTGWPKGVLLNVNFPDCEPDAVKGSVATVQGQRDPDMLRVANRVDTHGLGIRRRKAKPPKGTDIWAVRSNLISVTPLRLDLTDQRVVASLQPVLAA
jgi:5'-nucleotidase